VYLIEIDTGKLDFQWISIYANKCNNLVKEKDRAYGINTMYQLLADNCTAFCVSVSERKVIGI